MGQQTVYLRIYDLSNGFVKAWSPLILMKRVEGMWHTGVLVFGYEYFYGGGIVKLKPDEVEDQYDMIPVKVQNFGKTLKSCHEFETHLLGIKSKFHSDFYDLTTWNCNHFSDYILKYLVGRGAPTDIVDMPSQIESTLIGKLVITMIKKWSDGEAVVHSDNPMHPREEMMIKGEIHIKSNKTSQKHRRSSKSEAAEEQPKQKIGFRTVKGQFREIPLSPSLRSSKTDSNKNRLELINHGWLGSPNENRKMLVGSPRGVGRSIAGRRPKSPDRFRNAKPSFGIPPARKNISPVRPDNLLPTPPSAKYASSQIVRKREYKG